MMAGTVQTVGNGQEMLQVSFSSKCFKISESLIQIALRAIFVVANVLMAAVLFPISWHAVILPCVGLSSAILASFFFIQNGPSLGEKFPHPGTLLRPFYENSAMPANFTEHAPVGYTRERNNQNCAFNAVLHLLDSEPEIAQWLRYPLQDGVSLADFHTFLAEYRPAADLSQRFDEYVAAHPGQPILPLFHQFLEQYRPAPGASQEERSAYFSIKDAFRNLRILQGALHQFYQANDAAVRARQRVSAGDSQHFRNAASQLNGAIQANPYSQTDASEILNCVINMLPDRFKINMQETTHMVDPQLTEPARPVPLLPLIPLDFKLIRDQPNLTLEGLLEHNCNHGIAAQTFRRGAVDHISREFVEPPPALRFYIKRLGQEEIIPERTWDQWLLSFFKTLPPPQPRMEIRKDNTPVACPEELSIRLSNGQECRYRLASFATHLGDAKGGHFVSGEIRDGQKYLEDDILVNLVETPGHQQQWREWLNHSYLLIYLPIQAPQGPQ